MGTGHGRLIPGRRGCAERAPHAELRAMLLDGSEPIVVSEFARIEIASAVMSGARSGRLPEWRSLLDRIDADCGQDGPIGVVKG